jgi:hypothetical protein
MAAWLLAIGPVPERFKTDPTEEPVQDYNVWNYARMRAWAERQLYEIGVIKKINDQQWHRKALDFCDWIVESTAEQRRKERGECND